MKKDIEWAKKEIKELMTEESQNYPHDEMVEKEIVLGILNQLDEPEVLSQEWLDEHKKTFMEDGKIYNTVLFDDLKELLVPKQELPVIPQFVADYINRIKKSGNSLDGAFAYIKAFGWDDESSYEYEVYKWLDIGSNDEKLARAWLDGYEVAEEQKYYARIKGWENVTTGSERFNWVYFKEKDTVGVSKAIENKYQATSFTKNEWENLGINDDNAEFELVEELEK